MLCAGWPNRRDDGDADCGHDRDCGHGYEHRHVRGCVRQSGYALDP